MEKKLTIKRNDLEFKILRSNGEDGWSFKNDGFFLFQYFLVLV